eukprot:TRINITY_DN55580_c0_g1_i1.p3 TRINITY_DN55580_c0_g1~~TRINITY_DN55580_c0_g1_i1.p3  ORF type:complete len:119 (+),score=34.02 TRINITY_DN55580_c0_g1_i1:24-380(+)
MYISFFYYSSSMFVFIVFFFFFFQAEDGIRDAQESRGLGDVYKRQVHDKPTRSSPRVRIGHMWMHEPSRRAAQLAIRVPDRVAAIAREHQNTLVLRPITCKAMRAAKLARLRDATPTA